MSANRTRSDAGRLFVSAAWVIGLALVGKALGLVKDIVVAAQFGTTAVMDAFLVAFTVPTIVNSWLRTPIRSGFIPIFSETAERDGEDRAWRSVGVLLTDFVAIVAVAALVVFVAAPWIVRAIAPGFDGPTHELAASLTRIMAATIAVAAASGILSSLYHVYGIFSVPALSAPVHNVILIAAAVFLATRYGIRGLAWGVLAASVVRFLILSPMLIRNIKRMVFRIDFRHPMLLGILRLALPLFIGMAGAKLDDVVDRLFASLLAEGSISGLAYALRLIEIPKEVLILGFSTVLFPLYARLAAKGRLDELGDKLTTSMSIGFFVLLPVSVAMALLAEPVVRLIFQRGEFDERSVAFTVRALLFYTPTVWALGLTSILTSGFVALRDTKTPVITGFVRLGFKVLLVYLLIGTLDHAGVALATSLSHILKIILLLIFVPRAIRRGRYGRMLRGFAGAAAATAIMGGVLYLILPYADRLALGVEGWPRALALVAVALVGALVYLGAAWLLARRELRDTVRTIRDGFGEIRFRALRRMGRRRGPRAPGGDDGPPLDLD
ncbi:MAG: murein biosynthesis integral membrane protein MurJ [Candidatus Eisenbacteria bacterium]|nr:murein biosynthesis integral membrane protein MurJ [Candidatus Eisenbacteria bacterium]